MSIASILGFLATAVIARPRKDDRVAELERENARLKEELAFAHDACHRWRYHALAAQRPPIPLGGQHSLALNPVAYLLQQQAEVQAVDGRMRNAQNQQADYFLGLQNLDVEMFCNCVPSRGQVWAAERGE